MIAEYTPRARHRCFMSRSDSGETCLVVSSTEMRPETDMRIGLSAEPSNLHYFDTNGQAFGKSQRLSDFPSFDG